MFNGRGKRYKGTQKMFENKSAAGIDKLQETDPLLESDEAVESKYKGKYSDMYNEQGTAGLEKDYKNDKFAEGEEEVDEVSVEEAAEDLPEVFQSLFNTVKDWEEEAILQLIEYAASMASESDEPKEKMMEKKPFDIDNSPVAFSETKNLGLNPVQKVAFSEMQRVLNQTNERLDAFEKKEKSKEQKSQLEGLIDSKLGRARNRTKIKENVLATFSEHGYGAAVSALDLVSENAVKLPSGMPDSDMSAPRRNTASVKDPVLKKYSDNTEHFKAAQDAKSFYSNSEAKNGKTEEEYVDAYMKASFSELRGVTVKTN